VEYRIIAIEMEECFFEEGGEGLRGGKVTGLTVARWTLVAEFFH
jgi:hypothetical protein